MFRPSKTPRWYIVRLFRRFSAGHVTRELVATAGARIVNSGKMPKEFIDMFVVVPRLFNGKSQRGRAIGKLDFILGASALAVHCARFCVKARFCVESRFTVASSMRESHHMRWWCYVCAFGSSPEPSSNKGNGSGTAQRSWPPTCMFAVCLNITQRCVSCGCSGTRIVSFCCACGMSHEANS